VSLIFTGMVSGNTIITLAFTCCAVSCEQLAGVCARVLELHGLCICV